MKSNNPRNRLRLATRWFVSAGVVGMLLQAAIASAALVKQDFTGVVTIAPSGNPFSVRAGSPVTGFVIYDQGTMAPGAGEVLAIEVTFKLGSVTYACSLANPCKNDTGTSNIFDPAKIIFDSKGKVIGIDAVLRQPGSVDMPLMVAGGQFFAAPVPLCLTNAVCGALNFAAPVAQAGTGRTAWTAMGVGPLGIVAVTWARRLGD
jgi:hypothetical protein